MDDDIRSASKAATSKPNPLGVKSDTTSTDSDPILTPEPEPSITPNPLSADDAVLDTPILGATTPKSPRHSRHPSFSGSSSYQEDWDASVPPLDRLTVLDLLDNFALPQQLEKLQKGISAQTDKVRRSTGALKSKTQSARHRMVEEWRRRVPSADEQLDRYRKHMRRRIDKLGTVPKPVNLPSQRLENHGLDPNVEIVPKGTLGWGSRSSSSGLNAWGSPAPSPPNTQGGTGSPSHLISRPSSGGSGTRPSTASSDRSHEPASNAWGPSSRPTSSSGVLSSNQTTITSTRPRSAETRPGSSQLSRFAEPVSGNSAWGASGTAEKLGMSSNKINVFSLSSGDFPTLGSEKVAESQGREVHSSQGRPGSSSGKLAILSDKMGISPTGDDSLDTNSVTGTLNALKRESSCVGEEVPSSMEKWQRNPQPYPNASTHPQKFDTWPGIPACNSPDGVWYRGEPPGGLPYGGQGPPGSYPVEPFAYYRPHIPSRPSINMQQGLRPGAGPRGHHPRNGDLYRPQMPDSYFRPVMPVGPGVYPGRVPYEGYYGPPPVGFGNSSEQEAPVMGMTMGPCVYNRYPGQNIFPEAGNFHERPSGYDSSGATVSQEQMKGNHPHDPCRGPYKVLLKEETRPHQHTVGTKEQYEKVDQQPVSRENSWGTEDLGKEEKVNSQKSAVIVEASSPAVGNLEECSRMLETAAISEDPNIFSAIKKNSSLMHKIEHLNTKARIFDGHDDVGSVSNQNEQLKHLKGLNANDIHFTNETGNGTLAFEKAQASEMFMSGSCHVHTLSGDKSVHSSAASGTDVTGSVCEVQGPTERLVISSDVAGNARSKFHRRTQGVQGRVDYRFKGRFNAQEGDGWRKKSVVPEPSNVVPVENVESCPDVVQDHQNSEEFPIKSSSNIKGKTGGEYMITSESSDFIAQRAKMREMASQRAKQLQKEEEERAREQKAKALAKLEDLNRRTLAEGSTQKSEHALPSNGVVLHKQEESLSDPIPMDARNFGSQCSLVLNSEVNWTNNNSTHEVGESTTLSSNLPLEAAKFSSKDPVMPQNLCLQQVVKTVGGDDSESASSIHESYLSEQKEMNHKRKQNAVLENKSTEKHGTIVGTKGHADVVVGAFACSDHIENVVSLSGKTGSPVNRSSAQDLSLQQKKKYGRSSRNKHKQVEASSAFAFQSSDQLEENPAKSSADHIKLKADESASDVNSVHAHYSRETMKAHTAVDVVPPAETQDPSPTEAHNMVNNRRMPKNSHSTRTIERSVGCDTVVWAPVRSQNSNGVSEEACRGGVYETSSKNGHGLQSSLKNKRAEMERYVPKPVAKELAQQGNNQQPLSSSVNQSAVSETPGEIEYGSQSSSCSRDEAAVRKAGIAAETNYGESKQSNHGKTHGSWRKRGSTTSTPVQVSQDGSPFPLDQSGKDEKPVDLQPLLKHEADSPKDQTTDTGNTVNNFVSTELIIGPTAVKDQRISGRGKRHAIKGQKSMGNTYNNTDHKEMHVKDIDKIDTQSAGVELSQVDRRVELREIRSAGEPPTSHWQPKSQAHTVHNRQGSRIDEGQSVKVEFGGTSEKEVPPRNIPSRDRKDSIATIVQPHQSESQKIGMEDVPNMRHQEPRRERKGNSFRGPHPANQGPINTAELAPANVGAQHEQTFSSGFRKNGHQSGRFGRVREMPHGDRYAASQESSKDQHVAASGDRRRHNLHYEYQPVGSYNVNKSHNSFEGAKDASHVTGSRYRERDQNNLRHGGGKSHGSHGVRVAAGCDHGE